MKVILTEEDEGLMAKFAKKAYSAVKTKLVSILTGNQVLESIGTVIDLLSFLPGVDRKAFDDKMKELSGFMNGGIENMDELLKKVPLLETLFGEEKDCIKNIMKFGVFAQQISLGTYPSDKYDLSHVVAVQSTLIALIALWVGYGAAVGATVGIASCIAWIIKDLSVMCFNKVFKLVEPDLKEFEKWMKENNVDAGKIAKDLKDGKVNQEKKDGEGEQKDMGNNGNNDNNGNNGNGDSQTNESLIGAVVKGAAKLFGKGATKAAAKTTAKAGAKVATKTASKGAKTVAGKVAQKLAPAATKGARKVAAKALKAVRKLNPKTARVLRDGSKKLGQVLNKKGITMEVVMGSVGDYISNAYDQANEEDKKILDVMKEDLKNAANVENLKKMLSEIYNNLPEDGQENDNGDEQNTEGQENQETNESCVKWIPIQTRWILL